MAYVFSCRRRRMAENTPHRGDAIFGPARIDRRSAAATRRRVHVSRIVTREESRRSSSSSFQRGRAGARSAAPAPPAPTRQCPGPAHGRTPVQAAPRTGVMLRPSRCACRPARRGRIPLPRAAGTNLTCTPGTARTSSASWGGVKTVLPVEPVLGHPSVCESLHRSDLHVRPS